MSTNKTPNYQLHSWLPADEFHLSEINENFTKLDQELALETEALQDTFADEVAVLKTALAAKGKLVVGSYLGDGAKTRSIDLGAPIRAILIEDYLGRRAAYSSGQVFGSLVLPGTDLFLNNFSIQGSMLRINMEETNSRSNDSNTVYFYLAWVDAA